MLSVGQLALAGCRTRSARPGRTTQCYEPICFIMPIIS